MARKKAAEDDLFGASAPVPKPSAALDNQRELATQKSKLINNLNAQRNFSVITDLPPAAAFASFNNENDDPGSNRSQQLQSLFAGASGTRQHSQNSQVVELAKLKQGNPNAVSSNENHYQIMSQIHQELAAKTSKIGKGVAHRRDTAPVRATQAVVGGHLDAASSMLYKHLIEHRRGNADAAAAALEQAGHHLTDAATVLNTYAKGAPKVDETGKPVLDETGKPVYEAAAKITNPLSSKSGGLDFTHVDNKLEGINESYRQLVEREYGSGVIKTPAASYKIGTPSPHHYLVAGAALDESEQRNQQELEEMRAQKNQRDRLRKSVQEDLKLKKDKSENPDIDSSLYAEDPDLKKLDEQMPEEETKFNFNSVSSTLNSRGRRKAQEEAAKKEESRRSLGLLKSRYEGDYPTRTTDLEDDRNIAIFTGINNVRSGNTVDTVAAKMYTPKTAAPAIAPNVRNAQRNIAKKQAKFQTAQEAAQAAEEAKLPPVRIKSDTNPRAIELHAEDLDLFHTHVKRVKDALSYGEDIPENSARILGSTVTGHLQNIHDRKQREQENTEAATLSAMGAPGLEDSGTPSQSRSSVFHETLRNQGY
jgi:hypothetical protein